MGRSEDSPGNGKANFGRGRGPVSAAIEESVFTGLSSFDRGTFANHRPSHPAMKPTILCVAALLAAASPLIKAATPTPAAAARTEVVFVDPAKFTDVRDSYTTTDNGRDYILDELRSYTIDRAERLIPAGDKLFISVTDVDLAGDFEPWHHGGWDQVRIVKDIYPPRISLSFRVTDASNRVIKEGKRELRDTAFMMNVPSTSDNDPRRYEKQLIADWLSQEFSDLKKQ
jgi:hypothetical protein